MRKLIKKIRAKLGLLKPQEFIHLPNPKGQIHDSIGNLIVSGVRPPANNTEDYFSIHEVREVWTKHGETKFYSRTFYKGKIIEAPLEFKDESHDDFTSQDFYA